MSKSSSSSFLLLKREHLWLIYNICISHSPEKNLTFIFNNHSNLQRVKMLNKKAALASGLVWKSQYNLIFILIPRFYFFK